MPIPTSGFAAVLVVATFALTSCGGDDDGPATPTAPAAAGPTTVRTVTQTAEAVKTTATAPQTQTSTRAATPTTTAKPQTQTGAATTTTPGTTAPKPSGACPNVEVGALDGDVDVTYARIEQARKVSCATAALVAAEWGRQRLGIDKALLPLGWECTKGGSVCTNGASRVSFVLVRPG